MSHKCYTTDINEATNAFDHRLKEVIGLEGRITDRFYIGYRFDANEYVVIDINDLDPMWYWG